ncbi:ClpP/crotonase-like domain-containing protein [Bombardia bombarda]|uniref:ClpP/crotonase-like domain-containing protein n=1 Tax=Bombardia bombarda TaxID=252184 RepID=A0AA39U2Y6_9PEZI|nr:ClpP/crotonase-like domain-containing protein [Bombardia bombarda]
MPPKSALLTSPSSALLRRLSTPTPSSSLSSPRPVVLLHHVHHGPRRARHYYSTESTTATTGDNAPLIRVTDLPAPNSGHIRILELNRPKARNAISRALLDSLRSEIDAVHAQYDPATGNEIPTPAWGERFSGELLAAAGGGQERGPTRALILASAVDTSFCAGADLKERRGFSKDETAAFLLALRTTFTSLSTLPVPTISAISSLALGGGLELALSTHFRVLTSNATVGLPETRLGIIPGAGGTFRLPALIGVPRARDLIVTGRRVSAAEAYFLGLADRLVDVVPEDEAQAEEWRARRVVLSEAVRLAGECCEGGPVAVRAALRAVEEAREEVEVRMYERVVVTEDRDEALRAFGEKRRPVFKGSVQMQKSVAETAKDTLKTVDRAVADKLVDGIDIGSSKIKDAAEQVSNSDAANTVASKAAELRGQANSAAGSAKGTAQDLAGQAKGTAQEYAGSAKGSAQDLAGQAKGTAQEYSGSGKGTAEEYTGKAKGAASEVAGKVKGAASEVEGKAKGAAEEAKRSL